MDNYLLEKWTIIGQFDSNNKDRTKNFDFSKFAVSAFSYLELIGIKDSALVKATNILEALIHFYETITVIIENRCGIKLS